MNIALIGATGFVGSAVLNELLQRGHRVTVLARNPGKLTPAKASRWSPPTRRTLPRWPRPPQATTPW